MADFTTDIYGPSYSHSPQTITMPNCRWSYRRPFTPDHNSSERFGDFGCQAIEMRTGTEPTMCIKGVDEQFAEHMRSVLKCGNKGEIKAVYTDEGGASVTAYIEILLPKNERDHADCFDEAGEVTGQRNLYFAVKNININRQPARRQAEPRVGTPNWAIIAMPTAPPITRRDWDETYQARPPVTEALRKSFALQIQAAHRRLADELFSPLEPLEQAQILRGEETAISIVRKRRIRAAEQTAQREREQNYPKINAHLTGPTPVSEIVPKPTDAPKRRFAIKRPANQEPEE